jgi:cyclopropane fatty-acyl-phospholipid synthase-like methyltransferase
MDQKEFWNRKWKLAKSSITPTKFAKKVSKMIQPPATLLELGAGSGKDTLFFAEQGFEVTAVDFSDMSIEMITNLARTKRRKVKCRLQDLTNLEIYGKFDIIYADLTLHYFTDAQTKAIIKKIYSLLPEGGQLFARCKSTTDSAYGQEEELEKDMYLFEGQPLHFFSKEYMTQLTQAFSEVRIEEVSHIQSRKDAPDITSSCIELFAVR